MVGCEGSSDAELNEKFRVWASDDVGGDKFADAACRFGTCVHRSFHAADVAFYQDGEETAAGLNLGYNFDVGGFCHCVRGFDAADVAFSFDHAECSAHSVSWWYRIGLRLLVEFAESVGLEAAGITFVGVDVDL